MEALTPTSRMYGSLKSASLGNGRLIWDSSLLKAKASLGVTGGTVKWRLSSDGEFVGALLLYEVKLSEFST